MVIGHDAALTQACSRGSLELNPYLPLVAHCLLESCDLLSRGCAVLRTHCVDGIEADEARCRAHVEASTATATALLPALGYEGACHVVERARATGRTIREVVLRDGLMAPEAFDEMISPEAVCRLGMPDPPVR